MNRKKGKHIVFDIESNNWKDYVIGGTYDGETFETFDTLEKLCEKLDSYKNVKIFAHFGGIFDFLFLINHWGVNGFLKQDLLMRGSSIFGFKRNSNQYYDSSGILPFSLDKAAKAFNVKHKKLDIDHSKEKFITPELIKYLEHDCRALYEVIEKFYESPILQNTNFKPTLASTSIEVLRKYIKKPIPSINSKSQDDFVRQAYAGGRTEIYRPYYNDRQKPLFYYDFNSLYPSVMWKLSVPGRVVKIDTTLAEFGFTDCEIESPKDIYLPILWQKAKLSKFIFPTGIIRGVFPSQEIKLALENGYKIKKVYKSLHFENLGHLFTVYIDDLYSIKQAASDPVQRQIAKLLLNAGYGRLAIKRERESLTIDDGRCGITPTDIFIGKSRLARKPTFYRGFSNAAIGAMITAEARIKLWKAMSQVQDELYYCDTDSIITTRQLPTSDKLGELKLEGTAHEACFLLPKTYRFGSEAKMKGFPKEFAQSKSMEDFTTALEGDLRLFKTVLPGKLARIKSAKNNNGSILKVLKSSPRELRATYDKRIIFKENNSFNSRPIEL